MNADSISKKNKPKIQVILSIDTEEEWDWSGPFPEQNPDVTNVQELPAFQAYCSDLGIRTTYFLDYAVIDNHESVNTLKEIAKRGDVEYGAHLHPWVNPPFFGVTTESCSHVVNLPIEQVREKLCELTEKITTTFGKKPISFRTGRWGISGDILNLLIEQEYLFDSSIYPHYKNEFFDCTGAESKPFWPSLQQTDLSDTSGNQRSILEVPVSTGFNRHAFHFWNNLHETFTKPPFSFLHVNGILWHSHLLRKLYLSPELCTSEQMISLSKTLLAKGQRIFHLYLHSSSLLDNATEMSAHVNAREQITQRLDEFLSWLSEHCEVEYKTLSEAGQSWIDND
jgi:hypothetical protein